MYALLTHHPGDHARARRIVEVLRGLDAQVRLMPIAGRPLHQTAAALGAADACLTLWTETAAACPHMRAQVTLAARTGLPLLLVRQGRGAPETPLGLQTVELAAGGGPLLTAVRALLAYRRDRPRHAVVEVDKSATGRHAAFAKTAHATHPAPVGSSGWRLALQAALAAG